MGKNTVSAKTWLDKCYPDSAPSKATVERWFADFKRGRTDTNDAEQWTPKFGSYTRKHQKSPQNGIVWS